MLAGHGEAHRHVVGRRDELRLPLTADSDRTENRVPDVGDHATVLIEMEREDAEEIDDRQRLGAFLLFQRPGNGVRIGMAKRFCDESSPSPEPGGNHETGSIRSDDIAH